MLLAYAENADPTDPNLQLVVYSVLIIAGVFLVSLVPPISVRRRRPDKVRAIRVVMIVWALAAAGVSIYHINAYTNWNRQYQLNVQSGYLDPRDQHDRPRPPWAIWCGLCIAYAGGCIWAAAIPSAKRPADASA